MKFYHIKSYVPPSSMDITHPMKVQRQNQLCMVHKTSSSPLPLTSHSYPNQSFPFPDGVKIITVSHMYWYWLANQQQPHLPQTQLVTTCNNSLVMETILNSLGGKASYIWQCCQHFFKQFLWSTCFKLRNTLSIFFIITYLHTWSVYQ